MEQPKQVGVLNQGSKEPVPTRSGGNNEPFVTNNHARYGEDPAIEIHRGNLPEGLMSPNDVPTIRNVTRDSQINGTMQRHSSQ